MNAQSIYTTKHGDFLKGIISREYKTINQLEVNTIAEQIRKLNPRVNLGRHSLERLVGGLEIKLPQFNFACYARMTGFTQGAHCAAPIMPGTRPVIKSHSPAQQLADHELFVFPVEALKALITHPDYKNLFLGFAATTTDIAALVRSFVTVGAFTSYKVIERGGRQYITFSAQTKWSQIFRDIPRIVKNSAYRVDNPKVLGIVYATKHIKEAVVSGAKITIFACVAFEVVKYILSDEMTLNQLIGTTGMDIAKTVAASGASMAFGFGAEVVFAKMGLAMVGGPFAIAISFGVGAAITFNYLDDQFQITNKVIGLLDEAAAKPSEALSSMSGYYELLEAYLKDYALNPY